MIKCIILNRFADQGRFGKEYFMNKTKKIIAVVLCMIFLIQQLFLLTGAVAANGGEPDFEIKSPYDIIDWDTWGTYKFQPHCHTNASDGFPTIHEFVQRHYDLDYDVVALTDHGTLNQGWNKQPQLVPLIRLVKYERSKLAPIIPLTEQEYNAVLNGTAPSETRTHKNGMLDVPKGVELNMATPVADCHLTGYFCDYGQALAGVFGDYETPSAGVRDAGGISMLAHVGEYVYTDKDSENYVGQKVDDYYARKFARVFMDSPGSCVGMGINSATDAHTRCDRILYDQILQKTIPNGVTPWAFCFSDSHSLATMNDAYTMLMMPEFDMDHVRQAMVDGTAFGVSHYSNGYELNGMQEIPGYSDDLGLFDDESYYYSNETPMVTNIKVDNENDTISIEGKNFNEITWVSNGNVIRRESNIKEGTATLDLHDSDLLDDPSLFVRFYITGDYGICYSQPFTLHEAGKSFDKVRVPVTIDLPAVLRFVVTVLDDLIFKKSFAVWAFKFFALGYDMWGILTN